MGMARTVLAQDLWSAEQRQYQYMDLVLRGD